MFVGLFSTIAHAETTSKYKVFIESSVPAFNLSTNGTIYDKGENLIYTRSNYRSLTSSKYNLQYQITIADEIDYILFEGGNNYEFRIDNLMLFWSIWQNDSTSIWTSKYSGLPYSVSSAYINYTDGTREQVNFTCTFNDKTQAYTLSAYVSPQKDVKTAYLQLTSLLDMSVAVGGYIGGSGALQASYGALTGQPLTFELTKENKEVGLLKGLGDKISGMWNSLKDGFTNLGNGITNVFNSIIELPGKLWDKISEGLKNLFVPSEESMTAYKEKWDGLLSERLGAVYQVCDIVTDSWSEIGNADATDTINFPSATIDLPDDAQFTFGGYEVKIVPDGFDVLVQAIKLIVGIVCTLAFINGMLKRYDEIMGVEQ